MNGKAFWTAYTDQRSDSALYWAALGDQAPQPSEVMRGRRIGPLVVDGDTLLFGVSAQSGQPGSGAILRVSVDGGVPEVAVGGLDSVANVVVDGDALLFTGAVGNAEGLFTVDKAELGALAEVKKLYTLKTAGAILPTADALFVSSSNIDASNRYNGSVVRIDRSGIR